jgi:hypothetical protein
MAEMAGYSALNFPRSPRSERETKTIKWSEKQASTGRTEDAIQDGVWRDTRLDIECKSRTKAPVKLRPTVRLAQLSSGYSLAESRTGGLLYSIWDKFTPLQ